MKNDQGAGGSLVHFFGFFGRSVYFSKSPVREEL